MKLSQLLIGVVAAMAAIGGCQPQEVVAEKEPSPPESAQTGAKADEKAPSDSPKAELAKCEGCSMEVPKAELVSHDGILLCKTCMSAHKH